MRALVTGGAGFIGSTLVDRLLGEGHNVSVIDNLAGGRLENLEQARSTGDRFTFREADIRDETTQDIVAELQPEVVFHLAAQMDVRVSVENPLFDAAVNIMGALNVLEGARKAGSRKIVFASSGGTIYGAADESLLPFDESVSQNPISPYGITKKAFGDYLFAYRELHGMDYASMALANVFGPRQNPHGEAGVVAIFAQRLLAGEQCKIFGDGEATRDYVFVDDVVDAFVRAAADGTGLFNVGTGVETSVTALYQAMAKEAGVDQQAEYAAGRTGELQRSALDASKLRDELGWEPKTDVAEGARRVLDSMR